MKVALAAFLGFISGAALMLWFLRPLLVECDRARAASEASVTYWREQATNFRTNFDEANLGWRARQDRMDRATWVRR